MRTAPQQSETERRTCAMPTGEDARSHARRESWQAAAAAAAGQESPPHVCVCRDAHIGVNVDAGMAIIYHWRNACEPTPP